MKNEQETIVDKQDRGSCPVMGYQDVNVCVPITIKPFGEIGNAKTQCLGKPVISPGCEPCGMGKKGDVCRFTISQRLRVEVPVIFGARAEAGDVSAECGCLETIGGCKDYTIYTGNLA